MSSANETSPDQTTDEPQIPVVGMREPCPCNSGKRYKMCHGRKKRTQSTPVPLRTFADLAHECDLVAMREIVPAATLEFTTTAEYGGQDIQLATILPGAIPALHRKDGSYWLGLQVLENSSDVSRDLGSTVAALLKTEPDTAIDRIPTGTNRPRLQDVLDSATTNVVTHDSFDFWLTADDADSEEIAASLQQANQSIVPTDRLLSVEAAYWCRIGRREHLRWVLPDPEELVLDALARLHAAGHNTLADGSRYLGAFRTHGVVAPVWDLPEGWSAEATEDPAKAWFDRYQEALANTSALSPAERRARAGMVSRQLTLR